MRKREEEELREEEEESLLVLFFCTRVNVYGKNAACKLEERTRETIEEREGGRLPISERKRKA